MDKTNTLLLVYLVAIVSPMITFYTCFNLLNVGYTTSTIFTWFNLLVVVIIFGYRLVMGK